MCLKLFEATEAIKADASLRADKNCAGNVPLGGTEKCPPRRVPRVGAYSPATAKTAFRRKLEASSQNAAPLL